jgi:hypothetical protein
MVLYHDWHSYEYVQMVIASKPDQYTCFIFPAFFGYFPEVNNNGSYLCKETWLLFVTFILLLNKISYEISIDCDRLIQCEC